MSDKHQTVSGFAEIAGAPVFYEVAGAGHPLLLLHAGVADSRMWDDQWALFAQHYRVIRCDLPGYGQSSIPDREFALHEIVAGLLGHLNVERAHVAGASWGGRVALDFALAHPEKVAKLVLVCPSVGGEKPSAAVERFGEEEEALLERGDLAAATELNLRMWVDGPHRAPGQVDPSVRERVRVMQHHAFTIPTPLGAELIHIDPPAIERLAEVRVPTLVVVGDLDIAEKLAMAERLAAEIPGACQVVIPGAAHMVTMERPEEFNRVILDFLSRAPL
ncbi:MAG: alpha/beta fold hydrolase [Roseiflexaceae bacterium]